MKQLKYLLLILPFLFIGSVKADDLTLTSASDISKFHETFTDEEFSNNLNILINEYKENYYNDYPYYVINLSYYPKGYANNPYSLYVYGLYYFSSLPEISYHVGNYNKLWIYLRSSGYLRISYDDMNDEGIFSSSKGLQSYSSADCFLFDLDRNSIYHYYYFFPFYYSNFDLTLNNFNNFSEGSFLDDYDNVLVPTLSDSTKYRVLSLSSDNLNYQFEKLYDYDSNYNSDIFVSSYVEIDLNDYSYLVLSLKDYNKEPFTSRQYVKGEYCVSGAYDYGLSSKEKYDSSVTDICTPYYNDFTPVNHYVLENDLKNHAVYYLKAHDTSKENIIKVDSSVFNIHYITEEEADNPVININGRNYSILPFDELPSNSIKNTEEGFVPGASEKFSFSDIFTTPLEFLKDVWNSIVNVFDLVIEFIYLLPKELQGFLISSFYLAVAIGLAKMIL